MLKKLLLIISSTLLFIACTKKEPLGFSGPPQILEKEDGTTDTIPYAIPPFTFIDQDSSIVTNETLKGTNHVVFFFFATCPLQCPLITENLLTHVYSEHKNTENFKIVSISLDPEYDNCQILKEYAASREIDTKKWLFLKGDEDATYELMNKGFFLAGGKNEKAAGGIDHSTRVALIDKNGYLRQWYKGENIPALKQLAKDINRLEP